MAAQAALARTREAGIRLAVGATLFHVLNALIGRGILYLAVGAAAGLGGAFFMGRVLRKMLYGVVPADPIALASAVGILAVVALIATVLPARRVASVDPMRVLGVE